MENMDIEKERESLIKEIQQIDNVFLLRAIKTLLHRAGQEGERITVEQYNLEIDESEARIARGEYITHEDAIKLIRQYRT